MVSIHAPRVGRDRLHQFLHCQESPVSIHAPRVGRDDESWADGLEEYGFQSTRPVWGAT